MATIRQTVTILAEASAGCITRRMLDGYCAEIRAAGMLRRSGPGRAYAGAVDLNANEYALIMLAMVSPSAAQAVQNVQELAQLEFMDPQPGDLVYLQDVLAVEINRRAVRIVNGEQASAKQAISNWSMTVSSSPASAWLSWTANNREHRRYFQSPASTDDWPQGMRPMMRQIRLGDEIVDAAAGLLAQSMIAGPRNGKASATVSMEAAD